MFDDICLEVSCRQSKRLFIKRLGEMEARWEGLATILGRVFCL
jgi:hypothetical protein